MDHGMLPTCDKFETSNCVPSCTETLTTHCTESGASPNRNQRDRYEGRRTFKGEKKESPYST